MYHYKKAVLFCAALLLFNNTLQAEEVHIGTGTHSLTLLTELTRLFEKQFPNDKIIVHRDNYTTALLYKQIKEKNDIDLVLLIGMDMVMQLESEGLAVPKEHFNYAFGKLVLWSKNPNLVDGKGLVLKTPHFQKLGILDPKVAIYGAASQQLLEKLDVWTEIQPKLVLASNALELQQQVLDGRLDMALIPLVTLNPNKKIEGSLWSVPKGYYHPIEHQVVLLKRAEQNAAAKRFFEYLKSSQARNIIEKLGFSLP